jgi:predicted  nucleic acid-binding Zn-ribbon protein
MKFYLLLLPLFCVLSVHAQVKDCNKTRQVEQLQQLNQTISRKIDSLQVQLPELAATIVSTSKKIDQLKKEANNRDKPDVESKKEELSKLSIELTTATNLAESLRKKFDTRLAALDKALDLQKDLKDKITALVKEGNR